MNLLDLCSTPVAILPDAGLRTLVGLSAIDPLTERHVGESFRVWLTVYDAAGKRVARNEIATLSAGERRMFDIGAMAQESAGAGNRLACIHRIPVSLCPPGQDPDRDAPDGVGPEDYDLYRAVVQYALPGGGNGSVVYEAPPFFNDDRIRRRPSETLSFTSKIVVSKALDTLLCVIHYSQNPDYRTAARYRVQLLDSVGEVVVRDEFELGPFTATVISIRSALEKAGTTFDNEEIANYSLVAWSKDAALIPLIIQQAPHAGAVAIEHAHPAQAFLMPADAATRNQLKAAAIRQWDARFEASA